MKRDEGLPGCFFVALFAAAVLGYVVGDIATLVGVGLACLLGLVVTSMVRETRDHDQRVAAIAEARELHRRDGPRLEVFVKLFAAVFPEASCVTLLEHEGGDEQRLVAVVELTRWQRWRWRRALWRQQLLATELVELKPAQVVIEVQIKLPTPPPAE